MLHYSHTIANPYIATAYAFYGHSDDFEIYTIQQEVDGRIKATLHRAGLKDRSAPVLSSSPEDSVLKALEVLLDMIEGCCRAKAEILSQ